jgi:hypothetical protein
MGHKIINKSLCKVNKEKEYNIGKEGERKKKGKGKREKGKGEKEKRGEERKGGENERRKKAVRLEGSRGSREVAGFQRRQPDRGSNCR